MTPHRLHQSHRTGRRSRQHKTFQKSRDTLSWECEVVGIETESTVYIQGFQVSQRLLQSVEQRYNFFHAVATIR